MLNEFRTFIMRGNVIELAVGIIIGAAFTSIVNSVVNDLIMPIISLFTAGIDFSNVFIPLQAWPEGVPQTLAAAQERGIAVFAIGSFINAVINFLIVAFVVFLIVRAVNRLMTQQKKEEAPAAPPPPDPALELQKEQKALLERLVAAVEKSAAL
ncbi:large conductance mechanosensitive channel protein MscL [Aggregatilineales bacterium SYSU G02658]